MARCIRPSGHRPTRSRTSALDEKRRVAVGREVADPVFVMARVRKPDWHGSCVAVIGAGVIVLTIALSACGGTTTIGSAITRSVQQAVGERATNVSCHQTRSSKTWRCGFETGHALTAGVLRSLVGGGAPRVSM